MPTTRRKTADQWKAVMARWPMSWSGTDDDIPLGERLVEAFFPFVVHLAGSKLATATIKRHIDHLWSLGGEVIKSASIHDKLDRTADELLDEELSPDGGPWVPNLIDSSQDSFDATCRKFYKFSQEQTLTREQ